MLLKLGRLDEALVHFNTALAGIPAFAEYLIGKKREERGERRSYVLTLCFLGRGKTLLALGNAEAAKKVRKNNG